MLQTWYDPFLELRTDSIAPLTHGLLLSRVLLFMTSHHGILSASRQY
jgi:hypothetical protein